MFKPKYAISVLSVVMIGCESTDGTQGSDEAALGTQSVPSASAAPSHEKVYSSIRAGTSGCLERVPLCELLRKPNVSYGVYRVVTLTGRSEQTPTGVPKGSTYVSLERLGGPGPQAPIAKIRGGPLPDGTDTLGPVSLTVGEVVGLVLYKQPSSEWYTFSTPNVFRQLQPNVFGNMHEQFPGSEKDFLKKLELESRRGCPPKPPPPPSPEGMPAVITDYVGEEVSGI
jgi:hypothetical protein